MSKNEKNGTSTNNGVSQKGRGGKKVAIGLLTAAVLLSTASAVVVPLVLLKKKGQGGDVTTFTVHFESNGGTTVPDQSVVSGKNAAEPDVSRDGYTLDGWYAQGASEKFAFASTPITANITLTAQWTPDPTPSDTRKITLQSGADGTFDKEGKINSKVIIVNKGTKWGSIPTSQKPTVYATSENKTFSQWVDANTGKVITNETEFNSNTTINATYIKANGITLTFTCDSSSGEYITGNKLIDLDKGDAWTNEMAVSTIATKPGYEFKGWSLSQGGDIIEVGTIFTQSKTIYPVFDKEQGLLNFKFNCNAGLNQRITQGSETFSIPFDWSNKPKWSDIVKPTIVQDGDENYVFSLWLKKDPSKQATITDEWIETNKWKEDDVIDWSEQTIEAWPWFVIPTLEPKITFAAIPGEESDVTFVGNQIFQTTFKTGESSIKFGDIDDKPAAYWKPEGTWQQGFTSSKAFSRWVIEDSNNPGKYVPISNDYEIKNAITVYPEFSDKTCYTYYLETDDTGKPSGEPVEKYYNEGDTFGDVVKPQAPFKKTISGTNYYFKGWSYYVEGSAASVIPNTDTVGDSTQTKVLVPVYDSSVNTITFDDKAYLDGTTVTEITDTTLVYDGGNQIAIPKADTSPLDILKPSASIEIEEGKPTYTFAYWEYNAGDDVTPNWTKLEPESSYEPIASTKAETHFRPVFTKNITITFKDLYEDVTIPETQRKINVSSSKVFSDIYKPTVDVTQSTETKDMVFKGWYTYNSTTEKYEVVNPTTKFTEDTEIYALLVSAEVSSVVNFHLKETDVAEGATISGTQFACQHADGAGPLFSSITKGHATKPRNDFKCWSTRTGTGKPGDEYVYTPIDPTKPIPDGTLDLYAEFEPDTSYRKITVKENPTEYEVTDGEVYLKLGDSILANFHPTIKKVGKELDYFTINGVKVDASTVVTDNAELVPVLKKSTRNFTVSDDDIPGVTNLNKKTIEVDYGSKLLPEIQKVIAEGEPKLTNSEFLGWQIKNADGTYSNYTEDTVFDTNITIVPKWRGEAEFLSSDRAYFYDENALGGQTRFASIIDTSGDKIQIKYSDSSTSSINKADFKYEIKFGSRTRSIPDYFMSGCVNWDNGGKDLVLPSKLTSIGKYFLSGCSTFNQKIDFSNCSLSEDVTPTFTIGECFLYNCYSFNQDLDFSFANKTNAQIVIGENFMSECLSFTKNITIECEMKFADGRTTDDNSLSTGNKLAGLASVGFTVSGYWASKFETSLFPELSSGPRYRKYAHK